MAKRGLKTRDVAKDHFSSGIVQDEPHFSRLIVRFIEGKNLLASDVETGKSDPVAFVWCGPNTEHPNLDEADIPESGILKTSVCPTTVNPIWNEDVIFPLDVTEIAALAEMKCLIYIRDQDTGIGEGMITYDELGMLEIPFKDIFTKGKALKNSVVVSGSFYNLAKSPGMRKVDGAIKLTLTVIFAPDDTETILKQLPSTDEQSTNFTRSSINQLNSVSQKVQKFLVNPTEPADTTKDLKDPRLRLSLTGMGRPSSAKTSSRSSINSPQIAPMVRRPSTAPQKRPDDSIPENRRPLQRGNSMDNDEHIEEDLGEDEDEEGSRTLNTANKGGRRTDSRRHSDASQQGEGEGDGDGENDGDPEELIIIKSGTSSVNSKQAKQAKAKHRYPVPDDIGIEVGGYDLNDLLSADPDGGKEGVMEDIIRVGVNTITAALDKEDFLLDDAGNHGKVHGSAKTVARKMKAAARDMASEPVTEIDPTSLGKRPLQSEPSPSKRDTPAPPNEEETAKPDEVQLLESGPAAGDEGLLEDAIRSGLQAVIETAKHADLNLLDNAQDVAKAAGKQLKHTAGAVGQTLANKVPDAAKTAGKQIKNAAGVVGQAVKTVAINQASSVVDEMLPEANNEQSNDKKVVAVKGAPRNSPAAAGTGVQLASPRRDAPEGSPEKMSSVPRLITESFSGQSGEDAFLQAMAGDHSQPFLVGPGRGDQDGNMGEDVPERERPPHTLVKKSSAANSTTSIREEPENTALALSDSNAALTPQQQLQAELRQQAQGHATAVVRALKEMTTQRKIMEQSLEKIAKATAVGFSRLSERISHLEEALLKNSAEQNQNLLAQGPDGGDQDMLPDEEGAEDDENAQRGGHNGNHNRLNGTTPGRIESKGKMPTGRAKGKAESTSGASARPSSSQGRKAGVTSASPPTRRPQSAAAEQAPAPSKPKVFGNVGAIAMAKAAARANKKKQAHQPYATFEDSANASTGSTPSGNFHFQPKAQLLFKGVDGRVEASQLAAPPQPGDMGGNPGNNQYQQYPQQQQYDQQNNSRSGSPNRGYYQNQGQQQQQQDYSQQNSAQQPYYPSYPQQGGYAGAAPFQLQQQTPQTQQLYPLTLSQPQGQGQQQVGKYPLNREFSEVLERGSLEDIARLVESTAPRPEDLSASVRNRLYDAIATLLHQNSHTERCLIWVLALVRGHKSLISEVVGHTIRDLKEALENVALEASKRGLLASLLKSQINR